MIVCSVRHTGTQFYVWFLSRHPSVKDLPEDKTYIGVPGKGCYANGNVVHSHIGERPGNYDNDLFRWAEENKALIPLRDPILSIITHYKRRTKKLLALLETTTHSAEFVTDGFVLFSKMSSVLFAPVDLPWTEEERYNKLVEVENHFGIEHDERWVQQYAYDWAVKNSAGDSEEKLEYMKGNLDFIYEKYYGDIDYLFLHAQIIIPFLQKHGYNLPWYNWRPSM